MENDTNPPDLENKKNPLDSHSEANPPEKENLLLHYLKLPLRLFKLPLYWQILIALFFATVAGMLTNWDPKTGEASFCFLFQWELPILNAIEQGEIDSVFTWYAFSIGTFNFLGTLFLNALKMLIVPLIGAAIITGVAEIGGAQGFGRLGLKTLCYYITTSMMAILVGLFLVNTFQPGLIDGEPSPALKKMIDKIEAEQEPGEEIARFQEMAKESDLSDLVKIFIRMVPTNIIKAMVEVDMLALIFFSMLFGFFISQIEEEKRKLLLGFFQALYDVMIKITELVMKFAPFGVFGLVATTIASTGLGAFVDLSKFFFTVLGGLLIHFCITMPLLLALLGRVRPWRHFIAMRSALLTAFSTSSSSATLPRTIECVTQNSGVSRRITSFTLPLGATVNMDGTALYECVVIIFLAQCSGIHLDFVQQFTVVLLALFTSIGVAGIPSTSLVAMVLILGVVGIPVEYLGLIMLTDRILDMCRTSVNVWSDSCGAVIIGRSEGEKDILQKVPKASD